MGKLIYPEKLDIKDTIGITAPSAMANLDKIDIAENNLRSLEFNIIETEDVRKEQGIVSDSAINRANELLELYRNPEVKYIISARGGEFLMEILPYLEKNKEIIKNNPKWFQGYSDNSLLNLYITTNFNIATVHMENIGDFAMNPMHKTLKNTIKFMTDKNNIIIQNSFGKYQKDEFIDGNLRGYNLTEDDIYKCNMENVRFSGRIIGGCIDVFQMILGTKMDNTLNFVSQFDEGVIWYIDDCELMPCELYRRLWYMKEEGLFNNTNGFLIGRSRMEDENQEFSFYDAINRALSDLNKPIVYKVDIGHIPPQFLIVNGSYTTFEYNNGKGILTQELI